MTTHPLTITMTPPGHWHFTKAKHLVFAVADAGGGAVVGLAPVVTVRTMGGQIDRPPVTDHGDGSYSADYTAREIGADAATACSVAFVAVHEGRQYSDAWPVEIVRDGREDIFTTDGRYLYQVRYGWNPGQPVAGVPVDLRFEPRRALQEGEALDRRQPYRNVTDYLPGLDARIVIRTDAGNLDRELPAAYVGVGIYHAVETFLPAEVGDGRTYLVSLAWTDPHTGISIGVAENAFPLLVRPAL